jgi:hypothetical protein
MPPLSQPDLRRLVRQISVDTRRVEQLQAIQGIMDILSTEDLASMHAVAAAGAIPPLVRLLGAGTPDAARMNAAVVLMFLAKNSGIAASIAAAGAIPLLVLLLSPGTSASVQDNAVAALLC